MNFFFFFSPGILEVPFEEKSELKNETRSIQTLAGLLLSDAVLRLY